MNHFITLNLFFLLGFLFQFLKTFYYIYFYSWKKGGIHFTAALSFSLLTTVLSYKWISCHLSIKNQHFKREFQVELAMTVWWITQATLKIRFIFFAPYKWLWNRFFPSVCLLFSLSLFAFMHYLSTHSNPASSPSPHLLPPFPPLPSVLLHGVYTLNHLLTKMVY